VRAPWWLKIACVSGLVASLVYIYFTPAPIIRVQNEGMFAFKIVATVVLANAVGVTIYTLGKRRA